MAEKDFKKQQLNVIAENLKAFRKKKNMQQVDLADASGYSVGVIRAIEQKVNYPRPDTLAALAKPLGVEPQDFMRDQNVEADDLAQKVYDKLKKVMAGPIPEHLVKITELLKKLDPRKDSVMLTQLESMLEGYLIRYEVPAKKIASRR